MSAEDNLRDDLRATRERQVRMRSELRHLNERQEALQAECRSLGEHALLLEGALEEALVALDAQKPEEARALLESSLRRRSTETGMDESRASSRIVSKPPNASASPPSITGTGAGS